MGIIKLNSKIQKSLGRRRMVTRTERYSTIGSDLIVARCAQVAGVKENTVRSGILGLKEAIRYFVVNGHHIDLGPLGSLRLRIKAKAVAQAEQVDASLVSKITIGYRPSKKVAEIISNVKFS